MESYLERAVFLPMTSFTFKPCAYLLPICFSQAIFQAFEDLMVGSVTRANATTAANVSTNVLNTVLVDTPNLEYLNPALQSSSSIREKPLQEYVQTGNVRLYEGLVNKVHTKSLVL